MPGGRRCQVKRNTRTDAAAEPQAEIGLRARQVDRREPRVRHRLPRRATFPIARPEGGQARHLRGRRTRADRPQRSDLLQPAPRPLPRDGVRHPLRRRPGCDRADQRPRVDAGVPAAVPDRGPRLGRRRQSAVNRQRPSVGLDRHPPVRRGAVRGLLPRCRADHERLRRPAALGQVALPVVAHACPVIPNGRRSATGAASSTPRARFATRISTGCSARRSRRDPGRVGRQASSTNGWLIQTESSATKPWRT